MHRVCISALEALRPSLQHYRLFSPLSVHRIVCCSAYLLQSHAMTAWTVVALTANCKVRKRNRRCKDDVGVREASRAENLSGGNCS
ncbi:uncharacterized protein BDV14DRAFT_23629 [Aspergillus stella-maris]|uniref:uncharacterized protein n=1 Tax=Aspergillus stella-maris TaxID=1810926 RepID=UPI003CCDE8BF